MRNITYSFRKVLTYYCWRHSCLQQHSIRRGYSSQVSNNQYCVDLVRKCDHENFLACLLLPKDLQRAAFALRAFSIELAQIQDVVSDKRIGQMRMQFWKDALDRIFKQGDAPQAPIPSELAGACRHYKLSKRWFDRILEARASHLEWDRFRTIKDIEEHAENINSSLYYLMLQCAGVQDLQADHTASHLGKAQGLVTVLRATPHHAQHRKVYLPMDTLAQHGVSQEDFIRGKSSQSVKDVVFEVASVANQHLEKAQSFGKKLPSKSHLLFLNTAVCEKYLKRLQSLDFDLFNSKLQGKDHMLPYRLYMNKLRQRF